MKKFVIMEESFSLSKKHNGNDLCYSKDDVLLNVVSNSMSGCSNYVYGKNKKEMYIREGDTIENEEISSMFDSLEDAEKNVSSIDIKSVSLGYEVSVEYVCSVEFDLDEDEDYVINKIESETCYFEDLIKEIKNYLGD